MQNKLTVEQVPIEQLKPCDYNPRKWTEQARKGLTASLDQFGFVQPIVVNSAPKRKGIIIGGNFKLDIAREKGLKTLPVVWVNIPDIKKEKELNIRLNKNQWEWDNDLLADFDEAMLADVGFDSKELDKIFKDETDDDFDADKEAEKIITPTSKQGEIYQLGKHRLMCGDSSDIDDVKKLMGGVQADMVFTDPPYNVNYSGRGKDNSNTIKNDNMNNTDFKTTLLSWFASMFLVMKNGSPIYVCHADMEGINFRSAFIETGFKLASVIIWNKSSMVLGRSDYHWKHEPILYGWKDGEAHKYFGERDQTSVWEFKKPKSNSEHPTMKPVELVSKAIRNSSKRDDVVLDLFGGSGSTLIASEGLNRTCYTMELDGKYCDVIIARWEKLTGMKAVKVL